MQIKNSIILGIDPGYGRTGYGVIHKEYNNLTCKTTGCIETAKTLPYPKRLATISHDLTILIRDYAPTCVALEKLFFARNALTALRVAETRGIIILLAEQHNIPVYEFSPMEVKIAVSGYGKADKIQVQTMVTKLLQLNAIPRPDDAADALAIAITAAHSFHVIYNT